MWKVGNTKAEKRPDTSYNVQWWQKYLIVTNAGPGSGATIKLCTLHITAADLASLSTTAHWNLAKCLLFTVSGSSRYHQVLSVQCFRSENIICKETKQWHKGNLSSPPPDCRRQCVINFNIPCTLQFLRAVSTNSPPPPHWTLELAMNFRSFHGAQRKPQAPTRAFSLLKEPTIPFTVKNLLMLG